MMKRATETDVDALYERAKEVVDKQRATLSSYLSEPPPPIPHKGGGKAYKKLEDIFHARIVEGKRTASIAMYLNPAHYNDSNMLNPSAFGNSPGSKWWARVMEWDADMAKRAKFIKEHGTDEQSAKFAAMLITCHDAFRTAFAEGWNAVHPKVPGAWSASNHKFLMVFPEEKPE